MYNIIFKQNEKQKTPEEPSLSITSKAKENLGTACLQN